MKKIFLLLFITLNTNLFSQIDTTKFIGEVNSIVTNADHERFWNEIYFKDQTFRGRKSNDTIDIINLIKSSLYFNKFGFPDKNIVGDKTYIISSVWGNNKFPEVNKYTFPIIFEGYKLNIIDEKEYRYLFSSLYKRISSDNGYKEKPLDELYSLLGLNLKKKIDINTLIKIFEEESCFLYSNNKFIGKWKEKAILDSNKKNGKIKTKKNYGNSILIFQSEDGNYFFKYLLMDRSHYPQQIFQTDKSLQKFYLFHGKEDYIEILKNGDLKMVFNDNTTFYSPYKN